MLSRSFKFLYLLSSSVAKVVNPLFPLSDPLYDYNYTYFNFDKLLEYDLDQLQNPDTCSSSPLLIFDLKTLEGEGWGGGLQLGGVELRACLVQRRVGLGGG